MQTITQSTMSKFYKIRVVLYRILWHGNLDCTNTDSFSLPFSSHISFSSSQTSLFKVQLFPGQPGEWPLWCALLPILCCRSHLLHPRLHPLSRPLSLLPPAPLEWAWNIRGNRLRPCSSTSGTWSLRRPSMTLSKYHFYFILINYYIYLLCPEPLHLIY